MDSDGSHQMATTSSASSSTQLDFNPKDNLDPHLALSPLDKLVKHSRSLTVNNDKRFPTRSSSISNNFIQSSATTSTSTSTSTSTALSPSPSINRPSPSRRLLHPQLINIPLNNSSHSNPSIFTPLSLQFNHHQSPVLNHQLNSPIYSDYRNSSASYYSDRSDASSIHNHPIPPPLHSSLRNHAHPQALLPARQLPYNSALSQLSAALANPNPPSIHPPSPRRPSTGRVNSSTAMALVQREAITSLYGDQQTVSSSDHPLTPDTLIQPADHLEELRGPSPQSPSPANPHARQTWMTASSVDVDSEPEGDSARYASGHSLSSEDPFQYWHYEASRQSRDARHLPPIPANLRPALPAPRSVSASTPLRAPSLLPLSTSDTALHRAPAPNFSRPLRASAAHLDAALPTPPPSRDVSPRDTKPADDALALRIDTRALLARAQAPDVQTRARARSSVRSGSSVSTTSSTGSRRSWRNIFQRRSNASNCLDKDEGLGEGGDDPSATDNETLPAITFSQPDHAKYRLAHNHPSQDYDMPSHTPTRALPSHGRQQQVQWATPNHPSHDAQPSTHTHTPIDTGDPSQRLSIYSLPPTDEGGGRLSVAAEQGRYMSCSPVLTDASPRTPEPFGSQPGGRAASRASLLPPAMAKAKAHLAKTAAAGGGQQRRGRSAEEYLQAGIEAHEQGELERAAGLFERAAREGGGCGAGMLMWGLSLRHGWGCAVNEEKAFRWLQKAAESVVEDLEGSVAGGSMKRNGSSSTAGGGTGEQGAKEEVACKSELVLAIYELGMCFLRGWGCKKDKALAISYFELAARLGDPDAQQELGFCYANGKGTKKDLKKAAKYYRMASEQGVEMMGCQWIWKDKYN